jgi:hypothetical protein
MEQRRPFIAYQVLDTVGISIQVTNSICNFAITVLLGSGCREPALRPYFAIHFSILAATAVSLVGFWVTRFDGMFEVPECIRRRCSRTLFLALVGIGYPFLPGLHAIWSGAETIRDLQDGLELHQPRLPTRALREDEADLHLSLRLESIFAQLITLLQQAQRLIVLQLFVEGCPLLVTQLVMVVGGALRDERSGVGSPQGVKEAIEILVYISMAMATLQLLFRSYIVCRSFDIRVFCLKWMFCLHDLTTTLYMLVFLCTAGVPFPGGSLHGGNALSQAWVLSYTIAACIAGLTVLITYAGVKWWRCGVQMVSPIVLGFLCFVPAAVLMASFKLTLILWIWKPLELHRATYSSKERRAPMLLFAFLKRRDWTQRFRYICGYIDRIVRRADIKHQLEHTKNSLLFNWVRHFISRNSHPDESHAPPSAKVEATSFVHMDESSSSVAFETESAFLRYYSISLRIHHSAESAVLLFFAGFQAFTFVFPFLAVATTWKHQTPLLWSIFATSLVELAIMAPLLPRFVLYCRFLSYCLDVATFAETVGVHYHYPAPKDANGVPVSIIEAAIHEFYTPPHELALAKELRAFSFTAEEACPAQTGVRNGLLPFDVFSHLFTFSAPAHIDLTDLSREEAERFVAVAEIQSKREVEARREDSEYGEATPLLT